MNYEQAQGLVFITFCLILPHEWLSALGLLSRMDVIKQEMIKQNKLLLLTSLVVT